MSNRKDAIELPPETRRVLDKALGPLRRLSRSLEPLQRVGTMIAELKRDAELLERVRPDLNVDELDLLDLRILVATEVEADSKSWGELRRLRSRLQRFGLTEEEALERIAEMARDPLARSEVRPRDVALSRMVKKFGREKVRQAIGMSAGALRTALDRVK